MIRRTLKVCLALVAGFALASAGFAQGSQTSTLTGSVVSNDGEALPGVTVTVSSPNMQGERFAVSGINGDYILKNLPPGNYTVKFSLEGMQTVERAANLPLGGIARSDATMEVSAAEETIIVTGEAPSALETTTVGANFKSEDIDTLPMNGRGLVAVAELAGGLSDNGTVGGQVTIGGAFAYDNVFLINGVDITDRFFGQPDGLLIEESIEETQVLVNGVSAEYGRFSGGVINAITKSGGNQFTGTFRYDLSRPEWRDETPFEEENGTKREGDLSKLYSATLGGPVVRDRLWFFLAGLTTETATSTTLPASGFVDNNTRDDQRYEIKLTGNIASNHNLQASIADRDRSDKTNRQVSPLEEDALGRDTSFPNDNKVFSYNGVFTNSLFGELRYSEKHFGFVNLGNNKTDPRDSVFYALAIFPGVENGTYNAPYFDATDPEDRDNEQWYGALSYFLSTESAGSHDIKGGVEIFTDIGVGGNSQTSTGRVFFADYLTTDAGDVIFDAAGNLIPRFDPYYVFLAYWVPTRGARNEIETTSIFVNDRWNLNANWSFNLGVRYEDIKSKSQSGIPTIGSDSIVPRLGASYDVRGDGKYKIDATYAEYAGKANANQFGSASPAGNPSLAYAYYVGPPGTGTDFAPGFDLDNYIFYYFSNPLQTKDVDPNLKTPRTREWTVSGGMELPKGGYLKLTYANRDVTDFFESFVDQQSAVVPVTVGPFGGVVTEQQRITNSSIPERKYESIQLQGQYRILDNWTIGGNWTHELTNDGNFEGEAGQSPGIDSTFGDYPEILNASRNYPTGRLDSTQEDKVRIWSNYTLDFGRAGALDVGGIFRYDSPLTFSYSRARWPLSAQQRAANPGYISAPSSQTLFFGERGSGEYESVWSLDLALQYSIPVWRSVEPWVKVTVTNVSNETALNTYNTSITPVGSGPVDQFGLPTTFTKGVNFGKATRAADYQTPREYFISAGIRF